MSFNSFDISASGLYAQRLRMDTISSNIANVNTTRNPDGTPGPYIRKQVVFSAIYNNAVENPELASGQVRPYRDNATGEIMLRGGINYDSPMISNGVQVEQIVEDSTPPRMVYDPSHPDANEDGFVAMPNINIVTEMVDMMAATRAYEANVTSIEATKSMINAALKI